MKIYSYSVGAIQVIEVNRITTECRNFNWTKLDISFADPHRANGLAIFSCIKSICFSHGFYRLFV